MEVSGLISARRRGTAIVETEQGILVTAGRNKVFLLPGGGADHHESRTQAAMRELKEETGLKPLRTKFVFRHLGRVLKSHGHGYFQDHHTVDLPWTKRTEEIEMLIKECKDLITSPK